MELAALLVLNITSGRDEIVKLYINHGGLRSFVNSFLDNIFHTIC